MLARLASRAVWLCCAAAVLAGPAYATRVALADDERATIFDRSRRGAVEIRWQAATTEHGGQFRVYAGFDRGLLKLIDEQPATTGLDSYRLLTAEPEFVRYVFELRFVHADGGEEVLETALVRHRTLSPATVPVASSSSGLGVLSPVGELRAAQAGPFKALPARPRGSLAPTEPETPPPRT